MTKKRIQTPYYQSLTRRIVIVLIIVSITPLILISGFLLTQFQNSYKKKIYAHLGELVLKHKQNIDSFLSEKLSDVRFLAATHSFENFQDEAFLKGRLSAFQRDYGTVYEDLGVVDENGRQLSYAGPFELENADYSNADWFRQAMHNHYYISDVFLGLRGKPHFIISVRNQRQGKYWILRTTIDFLSFNSLVENLRIGRTGFAFYPE
jgi:two-component system NtrC family sensor kinase